MAKTFMAKPAEVEHRWHVVDASGKTLGRLASRIAAVLRGKHTPRFTPHVDTGDFVIVLNAAKVALTGRKEDKKLYYSHTQYPGGISSMTAGQLRAQRPEDLLRLAVKRMISNTPLGRQELKKLKIYAGSEHPHAAQKPAPLTL